MKLLDILQELHASNSLKGDQKRGFRSHVAKRQLVNLTHSITKMKYIVGNQVYNTKKYTRSGMQER